MKASTRRFFAEIEDELLKQSNRFGDQNHHALGWMAILAEEVGEANRSVLSVLQHLQKGQLREFAMWKQFTREELVQIAAVCVAAAEALERQEAWEPKRGAPVMWWEDPRPPGPDDERLRLLEDRARRV